MMGEQDYWLEHPEELKGQPKRTIADYVESEGILVPRRFDSLKDARRSHKAILLRSEHTQEYDGVSGLLSSPKLSGKFPSYIGVENLDRVKEMFFREEDKEKLRDSPPYEQYCNLLKISPEDFRRDTSFSIWHRLGGINRTICADSAIEGRYHIISFRGKGHKKSYVVLDNGSLDELFIQNLEEEEGYAERAVETYEKVRKLERFDTNHCPIMEFQTVGKRDYFLQYHRGRDFEPSTFVLERNPEEEIEIDFVRGATIPSGRDIKMIIVNKEEFGREELQLKDREDSYISNRGSVYNNLMFRRRVFQPIHKYKHGFTFHKIAAHHSSISSLFKPQISGIIDWDDLVPHSERSEMIERVIGGGETQYVKFHLTSDGRRALLSRI